MNNAVTLIEAKGCRHARLVIAHVCDLSPWNLLQLCNCYIRLGGLQTHHGNAPALKNNSWHSLQLALPGPADPHKSAAAENRWLHL